MNLETLQLFWCGVLLDENGELERVGVFSTSTLCQEWVLQNLEGNDLEGVSFPVILDNPDIDEMIH